MNTLTKEVHGCKVDADLERESWSIDWEFIDKVAQGNVYRKVIRGEPRYMMVTGTKGAWFQLVWLGNDNIDGWSLLGKSTYLREDGKWRMLPVNGKLKVGQWLQYNDWELCDAVISVREAESN